MRFNSRGGTNGCLHAALAAALLMMGGVANGGRVPEAGHATAEDDAGGGDAGAEGDCQA
jgi:hypothetical protein